MSTSTPNDTIPRTMWRVAAHQLLHTSNTRTLDDSINHYCFIIIISIQPEGRFWQEPEPSQATGMALAHCILGSFLAVGCLCFPTPLDVPTFASRCLHDMRDFYQRKTELWARNGQSILPVISTST